MKHKTAPRTIKNIKIEGPANYDYDKLKKKGVEFNIYVPVTSSKILDKKDYEFEYDNGKLKQVGFPSVYYLVKEGETQWPVYSIYRQLYGVISEDGNEQVKILEFRSIRKDEAQFKLTKLRRREKDECSKFKSRPPSSR